MTVLDDAIEPQVLMSPRPRLADSVDDLLARAPARFALVGTSYGGNLAMEVALAAPERVTALWLMGCNPAAPQAGGPDLAAGLEATPDAVFDMLAGLVVHPAAVTEAETLKSRQHPLRCSQSCSRMCLQPATDASGIRCFTRGIRCVMLDIYPVFSGWVARRTDLLNRPLVLILAGDEPSAGQEGVSSGPSNRSRPTESPA